MKINSLSIFCGAHKGHDPIFEDEAIELVNLLAEYSIDIVYGGGNVGLMKVISDRAVELGINVTGITLKYLFANIITGCFFNFDKDPKYSV